MQENKILLSLTTTPKSDWRKKIADIDRLELKEVSLFLTGIEKDEREKLYALLEKTSLKSVPHIHLRNDMGRDEITYLLERYQTSLLNIHPVEKSKHLFDKEILEPFRNKIYVENGHVLASDEELKYYAGVCLDFSHWEYFGKKIKSYDEELRNLASHHKIGCCHISAFRKVAFFFDISFHYGRAQEDFDYIKKYQKYLPEIISLELENDFEEQIKFKKYLEKILNIKKD
ncbi:MAG: hypothetical protein V3574_05240 [Candidatus Moraniibacteriota bacterium]